MYERLLIEQEFYFNNILACGNKKQKMKSLNNHFHMSRYVEVYKKEVVSVELEKEIAA